MKFKRKKNTIQNKHARLQRIHPYRGADAVGGVDQWDKFWVDRVDDGLVGTDGPRLHERWWDRRKDLWSSRSCSERLWVCGCVGVWRWVAVVRARTHVCVCGKGVGMNIIARVTQQQQQQQQ